jgi:hypothetical protein
MLLRTDLTFAQLRAASKKAPQDVIYLYLDRTLNKYITYNERIADDKLPRGIIYVANFHQEQVYGDITY